MLKSSIFYLVLLFIVANFSSISLSDITIDPIKNLSILQEDQMDIGRACLLFAKEVYPDLDIDEYSNKIDQLAKEIKNFTGNNTDPEYRIRALNTYLYQIKGFHFDSDDPYAKKLKNRYISGLLDTKSGSCFTMPLLYISITQRLGYPIKLVSAPQHLFLRYIDPRVKMQNIEATNGGGYSSDEEYINDMEIPHSGIVSGCYLKTMNNKELLAELFAENATYWAEKNKGPIASAYYEEAIKLNPLNAEVYRNYATLLREFAKYDVMDDYLPESVMDSITKDPMAKNIMLKQQLEQRENHLIKSKTLMKKALELGIAPPLEENYWIRQEQRRKESKISDKG